MKLLRPLFALLLVAGLAGCGNVCDRMCDAQADMMERCFTDWEMSWTDLSYDDKDHFVDRCHAVQGEGLDELSDETAKQDVERCCERNLEAARSDIDCESLLTLDCLTD